MIKNFNITSNINTNNSTTIISSGRKTNVNINGKSYTFEGSNIEIRNGKIFVGGKEHNEATETIKEEKNIFITIHGDVSRVYTEGNVAVTQNVTGSISADGSVNVEGNVNGSITCDGDVKVNGNCENITCDGDVNVGQNAGNISSDGDVTVGGDIIGSIRCDGDVNFQRTK